MNKKQTIIKFQTFLISFGISAITVADNIKLGANSGANLGTTRNGIPLVNIAKPSGAGISHNKFTDYNVNRQGLILNNATEITNSKLGGMIQGNTNLTAGSAKLIINEITSTNKSTLKGYTEVSGQKANVIVANPNGITCDGCGFINTPNATLTTGKPTISGGTVGLSINKGEIRIQGAGLNAKNTNKLSIISKAVKLNGALHANNLEVITGSNDVNLSTGKITSKGKSGTGVSIDSTILGGMYANKIKLVGTDKGVGVNLKGLVATGAGGFNINTDGKIVINGLQSKKDIVIQSNSSSVELDKTIYAKENLDIKAKTTVTNHGTSSANKATIQASNIINNGRIVAGADNTDGQLLLNAQNKLNNKGLLYSSKQTKITATVIANTGSIDNKGVASITADTLENLGTIDFKDDASIITKLLENSGLINAESSIKIHASNTLKNNGSINLNTLSELVTKNLNNTKGSINSNALLDLSHIDIINNTEGELFGVGLDVTASQINNTKGKLLSSGAMVINSALNNTEGEIVAGGDISLSHDTNNTKGKIHSNKKITISANINNSKGQINAVEDININNASINNNEGAITANNIHLETQKLDNKSGKLNATGTLNSTSNTLDNTQGELLSNKAMTITTADTLNNASGNIHSNKTLTIDAGENLDNTQGRLSSVKALALNVVGTLTNDKGTLTGDDTTITTNKGLSSKEGTIQSSSSLHITTTGDFENTKGTVLAESDASITSNNIINKEGSLQSNAGLTLKANNKINNQSGNIAVIGNAQLTAKDISNDHGKILAKNITITATGDISNQSGKLYASGELNADSATLNNKQGKLLSNQAMHVKTTGILNNTAGSLHSNTTLNIKTGNNLDNSAGLLSSVDGLTLDVSGKLESKKGTLVGDGVNIQASNGLNSEQGIIQSSKAIKISTAKDFNNTAGTVVASLGINIDAKNIQNTTGDIQGNEGLTLNATDEIGNQYGNISTIKDISIHGNTLKNNNGTIVANNITTTINNELNNQSGKLHAAGTLSSTSSSLNNRQGELLSNQAMTVNTTGAIDNTSGSLHSNTTLFVKSVGNFLNDSSGNLSSVKDLTLNTAGQFSNKKGTVVGKGVTLTATQGITNTDGTIQSSDKLNITSQGAVNNTQGRILASKNIAISAKADINNKKGTVHSAQNLSLKSTAGKINNNEGLLSSLKQLSITAYTNIINTIGNIIGDEGVTITASHNGVNNTQGKILAGTANKQANITITSHDDVINNSGQILSTNNVVVTSTASKLLNKSGEITASNALTLNASSNIDNTNGKLSADNLTLNSQALNNKSGTIYSGQTGTIHTKQFSNISTINAYGTLSITGLNSDINLSQGQAIISNGQLVLSTTGNINNAGIISSEHNIILSAKNLNNATGAIISSAWDNTLQLSEAMTNNGRISAYRDLSTQSTTLTNKGAINSGRDLILKNTNLTNNQTLFSGRDMYLYTSGLLHNTRGANIYSDNNLTMAKNNSHAKTNKILNESATIESAGNGQIFAKVFVNTKGEFEKGEGAPTSVAKQLMHGTLSLSKQEASSQNLQAIADAKRTEGYDLTGNWVLQGDTYVLNFDYSGKRNSEIKREVTSTTVGDMVIKNSPSAKLIVGGKLQVNVDTTKNYQSLIAANDTVNIVGATLDNAGEEMYRTVTESGRYYYSHKECRQKPLGACWGAYMAYDWASLPTTTHNKVIVEATGYSTIQAGNGVTINANEVNNTASQTKSNSAPIGLSSTTGLISSNGQVNKQTATRVNGADNKNISGSVVAQLTSATRNIISTSGIKPAKGATKQTVDNNTHESNNTFTKQIKTFDITADYTLPEGQYGLFVTNTNPDHPYLIESNPDFTSYTTFIGSSYMMDQLNLDGDKTIKRLGDDFFENHLVRDQIYQQTGRRFFNGYRSDYQQYQALMNNALKVQKTLGLSYGVSLTPAQAKALTQNIVWMETQIVDGHKVLVPRLYLADVANDNLRGANIIGSNVDIQSDNFTNTGAINAINNLRISATKNVSNLGGNIRAGNIVSINANKRFDNISGTVRGNVVDIRAKTVNIETATSKKEITHAKDQLETLTKLGDKASISAKKGITIVGASSVKITGADVKTQTGKVQIASVGNVTIGTAKQESSYTFNIAHGTNFGNSTKHTQSSILGDKVEINSTGASIVLEGANVKATDKISLNAKDKLILSSVKDSTTHAEKTKRDGIFGMDNTYSSQKNSTKVLSTTLKANKVSVSADTLILVGSQIEAQTADISAKVTKLISDKNSDYQKEFSDESGLLLRVIEDQGHLKETAVASTINATKLIFNQKDISQTVLKDNLIASLSSENDLSAQQIETLKQTLNNKEWHEKTTTLSKTGALIVQAVATAIAPGAGNLAGNLTSNALIKASTQAALNSLSSQITKQLLTVALTGDSSHFNLKDITKNAIQAGLTAGISIKADGFIKSANLGNITGAAAQNISDAAIKTAVNGGSFEENIINGAIDDLAKKGANYIGDETDAASLQNIISHAALGCVAGQAKSKDCGSGAAGAALSAALAPRIATLVDSDKNGLDDGEKKQVKAISQIASMLLAGAAGSDVDVAFESATNEVTNNYLNHTEQTALVNALEKCEKNPACDQATVIAKYQKISVDNLAKEINACSKGLSTTEACKIEVRKHAAANIAWPRLRGNDMSGSTRDILTKFHLNGNQENGVIAQIQISKTVEAALASSDLAPETKQALVLSIASSISGVVGSRRGKVRGNGKPQGVGKDAKGKFKESDLDKLNHKDSWTPEQIKAADRKKQQILNKIRQNKVEINSKHGVTNAERKAVTNRYRRDLKKKVESIYENNPTAKKNALNKLENSDIDHIVDLQLNGKNNRMNLKALDSSVNRSYGKQLDNIIKDIINE